MPADDEPCPRVEILTPRDVPLGGPRSMSVRRTLPQRHRSLIGAWCFLDHYGPDEVAATGGMVVPPHPHSGLQTLTWLFAGEVEHRDSGGGHAFVRPGTTGLMTAGHGICHSEMSTPATTELHGVQLWIALPDEARDGPRGFHHAPARTVSLEGARVTVFVGDLVGESAAAPVATPLLGAEIVLDEGVALDLGVDETFEHGVLVDAGIVSVLDIPLAAHELGYVAPGEQRLSLVNLGPGRARVVLLGGTPFTEPIAMWWNFVGRDHDDIVAMREQWAARSDRYGAVEGYVGPVDRLEAPELPNARIRPRTNPS
ncbi:MAG: pirin family protein [Candidatus Nanopelagicales bacterium]